VIVQKKKEMRLSQKNIAQLKANRELDRKSIESMFKTLKEMLSKK